MNLNEAYMVMQKECGIKVGDTVKVIRKAESHEMGWGDSWNAHMDKLVGQVSKVFEVGKFGIQVIGTDETTWYVPFFVLEKVKPDPVLIGRERLEATESGVKFGKRVFTLNDLARLSLVVDAGPGYHYFYPDGNYERVFCLAPNGWSSLSKKEAKTILDFAVASVPGWGKTSAQLSSIVHPPCCG